MKINFENKIVKFLCIIQWFVASGIIYYFSSQSRIEFIPSEVWDYDKLVHFAVFMIYGLSTILLIFGINCRLEKWIIFIYSLIIGIAFAGFDEIHQSYTPGRDSDFYDFLADLAGILMSILIFKLILKKSKLIKSK